MKIFVIALLAAMLLLYGCAASGDGAQQPAAAQQNGPTGAGAQAGAGGGNSGTGGQENGTQQMPPNGGNWVGQGNASAGTGQMAGGNWNGTGNANGTENSTQAEPTGIVREFTIDARIWEFEPSTIEADEGDTVRITLVSEDVSHGIFIPQFGFDLKAGAGENATGEFVAGSKGTYAFRCNVFCGEGHMGMVGTLVVN